MRILDRYVTREFLKLFLLFSVAAPILFILGDYTDNLDTFTERGLSTGRVFLGYLYQLPQFVLWSFPIAALVATVFTVGNMTRHSELAAAKAGGISFYRAVFVLPLLGVILTIAGLGLSELIPITEQRRQVVLGEDQSGLRASRGNFVYSDEEGHTYSIQRLDVQNNRIFGLTMEREGNPPRNAGMHVIARSAQYDTTRGYWILSNGFQRIFTGDRNETTLQFQMLAVPGFREPPEQLLADEKDPEEMGYVELGKFIKARERSGGQPYKLMVDQAQKIAIPVATLIIILFGAPLANASGRGGPAYGIGISLAITIVYLMLFRLFGAAGNTNSIPPVLAAWLPNAIFLVASGGLLAKVRT